MRPATVIVLMLLTGTARSALAQDPAPRVEPVESPAPATPLDPVEARRRAVALDREAQAAYRTGDVAKAAELWTQAAELDPSEPVLQFNRGVAAEAAGDRKAASLAYAAALTGARDDVEARALFNAGTLALEDAWNAARLLAADPTELEAALAAQSSDPDAPSPSREKVAEALKAMRAQAASTGLASARSALGHLRELVRRSPDNADALHNLELAQRARKVLVEEQQRQEQQGRSDEQDDPDQKRDQETGEQGGDQREAEPDRSDGVSEQPDDKGSQGKPQTSKDDGASDERQEAQQQEVSEDEAKELLDRMLEAAARRARDVREQRASKLRKTPVEKDW